MTWDWLVQRTGKYCSIRRMEYQEFQTGIFGRMESAPASRTPENEQFKTFKNAQQNNVKRKTVRILLRRDHKGKWRGVACQKTWRFTLTVGIIQLKYKRATKATKTRWRFALKMNISNEIFHILRVSSVKTFVLCSRTRLDQLRRFHFIFPSRRK